MLPSRVLNPASGIGKYWKTSAKIIRFARHGCANRPFFHIVVMEVKEFLSYMWLGWHDPNSYIASRLAIVSQFVTFFLLQRRKGQQEPVIEQIGTYDPMPNERNEKLISFNFERIRYWIGNGAHLTVPVAELLGKHTFWDCKWILELTKINRKYCRNIWILSGAPANIYDGMAKSIVCRKTGWRIGSRQNHRRWKFGMNHDYVVFVGFSLYK